MQLFAGLGNPGAKHASTRHNLGFLAADAIAARHDFEPWRSRHHGLAAKGAVGGERVLLLKPMTYMNRSGVAVADAMRFFKLTPAQVVVIHDEIDLAPGKVRVKTGGGAAGHNGLRSVDAHIGPGFKRVRIGIGHPGDKDAVEAYVLHPFYRQEMTWVGPLVDAIAEAAPLLAAGDDAGFTNRLTLLAQPPEVPSGPGGGPAPRGGADK